jgi:hypothetical protein
VLSNILFYFASSANSGMLSDTVATVSAPADTISSALTSDSIDIDNNQTFNSSDSLQIGEQGDSLIIKRGAKKKEKIKPDTLATYFFDDTLLYGKYISWSVNRYFNSPRIIPYTDTLQNDNITELPLLKAGTSAAFTGITGGAALLHDYFKRENPDIFPFMNPYSIYHFTPDNLRFYNVKGPLSDLSWHTSGTRQTEEENVKTLFTRNITPSWNAGIYYHKLGALGQYQNQRSKVKTFNIFTSYIGKKYVAHAGYIYNSVNNRENGGIINDFFITDTVIRSTSIDVRLKTASNDMSSDTYFLTHSYGIPLNFFQRDSLNLGDGTMVYVGHSFEYSRYARIYTDGISDTAYVDLYKDRDNYRHYYDNYYLYPYSTRDSSFASRLDNRLFVRLQPYSPDAIISKIDAGIAYRIDRYYGFNPASYLYGQTDEKYSTGYVYGNAQGMFSKYFSWQAFLEYCFLGYRFNDLRFDATASLSLYPVRNGVHLTGRFLIENKEQPYFIQKYFSNHFQWNNSFFKTTENRIEVSVDIPDFNVSAGFKNSIISNYVYFNDQAMPTQASDILNITSIHASGRLKWWLLRLDARFQVQNSSNSKELPLPLFSGNARFYIESKVIKNVLEAQIGLDVYYNTSFYDYAYNPATGTFHTQSEKRLGNYPWADAFASFKWKQANIYVKFTNVGEGIAGDRNYFSALHYPRTPRMLRYGIRWFFDN